MEVSEREGGKMCSKVELLPNGVTVINIEPPGSKCYLSHTVVGSADFGSRGIVLNNNGGGDEVEDYVTQLAGTLPPNQSLKDSVSARVILIEVIGSGESTTLNGFVEVAGAPAQVILASAAGIQVDGAGFVNVIQELVLVAGVPFFKGGKLDKCMLSGNVDVLGEGMDGRQTETLKLIGEKVKISGVIHGGATVELVGAPKEIFLPMANNRKLKQMILAKSGTEVADELQSSGVIVDERGGLHARKELRVVSTALRNGGKLESQGIIRVFSRDDLMNTAEGRIFGRDQVALETTTCRVVNEGYVEACHRVCIIAGEIVNARGGEMSCDDGVLQVDCSGSLRNNGRLVGGRQLVVKADHLLNADEGRMEGSELVVEAVTGGMRNSGVVSVKSGVV